MIDTRDLAERRDELVDGIEPVDNTRPLTEEESKELADIRALEDSLGELEDGVMLVPERDFEEYAREFAEDIGAIPDDAAWPTTCIDWEQAARELAMDYTHITYQGEDYLYRA
jgi:hypothetical protein